MIKILINASLQHRGLVFLLTAVLAVAGIYALRATPVDAIPDLSDVQVIIKTEFPGQAPQVVEDQVTYPLSTAMLAVPGAVDVRGYSFFGDSYIYILFEEGTDLYWARSRVLEYLSQARPNLPDSAQPALGPDATGVGWVYEYALVDRSGGNDLASLRSLQDWFLRYELQSLPGVAEVATIGGMVPQYQVLPDPHKLRLYGLTIAQLIQALEQGSAEAGGALIEMAEAEYMVRGRGYITRLEDLAALPVGVLDNGTPLLLEDIAEIRRGPQIRRGLAELNGEGEVVGGVVVMRQGENARATIAAVKQRLTELSAALPAGVEIVTTYDRSRLIGEAVAFLNRTLLEEVAVVSLLLALFLWQWRASLIIIITLPVGVLAALLIMRIQGVNANIMSLGGIALAIGTMVDAAIVMIENAQRHLQQSNGGREARYQAVAAACREVGGPLFFSLLIITLSFMPVFTLQAQEGRLFAPLAFTKTYAMAAAAILAITLLPALLASLLRPAAGGRPLSLLERVSQGFYMPLLEGLQRLPWLVLLLALGLTIAGLAPLRQLGSEFMPALDEGDWLYMPSTDPALSPGKARELLQQTNRILMSFPEVDLVFGKAGRAETATDPAPLTMIETVIQFKPRDQWRPGVDSASLRRELDQALNLPGLRNTWVMPIRNRIDMLATGIKTPVGIKITGPDLSRIEALGRDLERLLEPLSEVNSVYADRAAGGRYVMIDVDRRQAARYGMNMSAMQQLIRTAIGGMNIAQTVEGRERYPINLRFPQAWRDSVSMLRELPLVTASGAHISLGDVARVQIASGPPMIKSENGRLSGWVYIDLNDADIGGFVQRAKQLVGERLALPPGYALEWTGQFEYLQRAEQRLRTIVPATLALIVLLLYLSFRRWSDVVLIISIVPPALIGGVLLIWWLNYQLSVAVVVGFIALAGVAVELGVVMLTYLHQHAATRDQQAAISAVEWRRAVAAGAGLRLRPVLLTVITTIAGLIPVMLGQGTGSEVMRRIAAPMVGGMVTATLASLLLLPVLYGLWFRPR